MGAESDANGNYHDDNGRFVSLRAYVERIFDEREKGAEFARLQLERALIEARATTERAMNEAKVSVEQRLVEAKVAADAVSSTFIKRLDNLESGGAPFASRLDQSLTQLKSDVDTLKDNMVRTTVLDALREQTVLDTKNQKRQIRYIAIAAAISFVFSLVLVGVQLLA